MKTYLKKAMALLLCGGMLFLNGCSGSTNDPAKGDDVAMGRYIETVLEFPEEGLYTSYFGKLADGTLRMISGTHEGITAGPWTIYDSADAGKSWTKVEAPWLSQFDNAHFYSADYDKEGNLYLSYSIIPEEQLNPTGPTIYTMEMVQEMMEGKSPFEEKFQVVKITPEGVAEELDVTARPYQDNRPQPAELYVMDNGDYLVGDYDGFVQYDPATLEKKMEYNSVSSYLGCFENYFYAMSSVDSTIQKYDLTTGQVAETIPYTGGRGTTGWVSPEGDFYLCDRTGIYKQISGGTVLEKVVDGELTSLNMPSVYPGDLVMVGENDFLVNCWEGDYKTLMSYSYSKDTPSVPTKELKVFSLYDNDNIRQAMGLFQRANPDVHVVFEPVITGDSAVTVSDAIRTINTEILAGKGPDVLVLDDMPIDSYIEKGVLADLSGWLTPKAESGELLSNIAKAYERDGKTYAVPARFMVPGMWADQEVLDQVHSLTDLADWAQQSVAAAPGNRPLFYLDPESLIDSFYVSCAPGLLAEDGSLKEAEFAQFLTDLGRLSQLNSDRNQIPNGEMFSADLRMTGFAWAYDDMQVCTGILTSTEAFSTPEEAAEKRGSAGFAPQVGLSEGDVYLPKTILGVNSASAYQTEARAFIETVLSTQVQNHDFGDGFPINQKSFDASVEDPNFVGDDGLQYFLDDRFWQVFWPDEGVLSQRLEQLKTLGTPVTVDSTLLQMMKEETAAFFEGTQTAEQAASAVAQRAQAFLSE